MPNFLTVVESTSPVRLLKETLRKRSRRGVFGKSVWNAPDKKLLETSRCSSCSRSANPEGIEVKRLKERSRWVSGLAPGWKRSGPPRRLWERLRWVKEGEEKKGEGMEPERELEERSRERREGRRERRDHETEPERLWEERRRWWIWEQGGAGVVGLGKLVTELKAWRRRGQENERGRRETMVRLKMMMMMGFMGFGFWVLEGKIKKMMREEECYGS